MPVATPSSHPAANPFSGPLPRDARLLSLILSSMGIYNIEPAVLLQLLEFAHRYTYDVLSDALVYADHAAVRQGTTAVSLDDVTLAVQSRVGYSFTRGSDKDTLLSLATSLNALPLPPISDRHGIRLPPPSHCLTNVNFQIIPDAPPAEFEEDDNDDEQANLDRIQRRSDRDRGEAQAQAQVQHDIDGEEAERGAALEKGRENDGQDDEEGGGVVDSAGSASKTEVEAGAPPDDAAQQQGRGVKRSLDEDEDYD